MDTKTFNYLNKLKLLRNDKAEFFLYNDVCYINNKTHIIIKCPLHGYFKQLPSIHLNNSGCKKCNSAKRFLTKEKFINNLIKYRIDKGQYYNYSLIPEIIINNKARVRIICPKHGVFKQMVQDHYRNSGCIKCFTEKPKKYVPLKGKMCVFSREDVKEKIKNTNLKKYGCINPSQNNNIKIKKKNTHIKNYGVGYGKSDIINSKRRKTCIKKYGVPYASQVSEVKEKMMATKLKNNSFSKINSSNECRQFIRQYIKEKGYSMSQVAYDDIDNNCHEWGYKINDKWVLYDFVAFKPNCRGDKSSIIEIMEYHGPFHYNEDDVKNRGNELAYPWKSKNQTIEEVFNVDKLKECFGKSLTSNYNIIWAKKYHNNEIK